jgi:hypothetical protein
MIRQREITTHVSKQADGSVLIRLVHKPTGVEAHGKGSFEEAKSYCLNALEHQLGDEIEGTHDAA